MADSELTKFQKAKILRVFNILYDSNKDGYIEEKDFTLAIEKVCLILEWPENSEKHRETEEALGLIWTGLKTYADVNADGRVSKDEWICMWEDCIRSNTVPEWQEKFMEFMFNVNDKSGDKEIDAKEYETYYSNYISVEECRMAFHKMSGGENISRSEFRKLWKEYFFSDDREAKGNYLFGVPDFLAE
ncbi:sarcoplasmic calcium-binding proteins I, III, and IV-like [Mizuhopecten yessoensis]|uniref:Calexcitin-1 n=1 Tax=Mizuhopecten yessoensis TaxID=6573 RepID=A0A210QXX6_MIZYE|nr:sarcoplasmic calcium-binding proteins I, III, and IV-like [Mizuhopecten yessoensis]OWF53609.1 Calexcitin-1 [Mizuhopecten yessoensis]